MSNKKIIISGLISLSTCTAFAQQKTGSNDTTIKGTTIEISQIYQPQVKQAVKETYNPTLPPADHSVPDFKYEVPAQVLNYSYKPLPLQPLAIGTGDTLQKGFQHYVKAGLGNRRTLYLDAGLGSLNTKNFESTVHLGILSQKGKLAYQKQTVAALSGEGLYHKDKFTARVGLDATHNNFFQYGYNEAAQPNKIPSRQTLSGGTVSLSVSKDNGLHGFTPEAFARIGLYTGSNISNENTGALGFLVSRKIEESDWSAKGGIEAVSTHVNSEFYSVSNSYASLKAGVDYDNGKFRFKGYLMPTIGQNSNSFLLNDIEARYHLDNIQTNIGAGLKGSLTQNTYQQLFLTNPYFSQFSSKQTHTNEIFGFVEKGFGHHLTFSGKLSWWQYENFATFLNSPGADAEKMMVYYIPKVNAISLQVGARYQIGNTISVGAQLALFNYSGHPNTLFNTKVWHTPGKRLNGDLLWSPIPELSISAYSAYVGGNYALDDNRHEVKLKAFLDLGFGAEYLAVKKLSFFLNCNNLLNNKYQRWLGYQAYGINIYGGVRLKF